jgi:hypothetical protein
MTSTIKKAKMLIENARTYKLFLLWKNRENTVYVEKVVHRDNSFHDS